MKKSGIIILALISSSLLFGETLKTGDTGTLGIETSTTFSADLNDGSTGLETKAGIEAIFNLFPKEDRGLAPEDSSTPAVRIELIDSSFNWWNKYKTVGGNLEQDDFNSWTSQPLVLTFESLTTDVIWKDYYFRVAGSKPEMVLNSSSLKTIFDDVMDASKNRWYISRKKALYYSDRYNKLNLPLLGDELKRDLVSLDFSDEVTGQLGFGIEKENFNLDTLIGSLGNGVDNNNNAWVFSIDTEINPTDNLEISTDILLGLNLGLDKTITPKAYQNPIAVGLGAKYLVNPESNIKALPFLGFDAVYETDSSEFNWEFGGGLFLYFSDIEKFTSHRSIDMDEVITQGLSISVNYDNNKKSNLVFSCFEDTSKGSLFGNLGGFIEFEATNILEVSNLIWAVATQGEFLIKDKYLPYLRETITPNSGNTLYNTVVGLKATPLKNLTLDIKYEREDTHTTNSNGLISFEFNISL
ncbi:hypothetical protein EW093_06600 [Thiospirochaeta perfilievii]|uniref:Uncharacterized protein n=1 Tax=Thiospirochaeta perfilievii TaxID=252967 RepID=A0A5C1QBE9_9SPIO|nr:hypothetical protein [Thiospirochaeta perfilievii]QEN04380.1 hypothetical protein EW093_06600 [Thiospirochaeta perfilievii]